MKILYITTEKRATFETFLKLHDRYGHEIHLIGGHPDYRQDKRVTRHDINLFMKLIRYVNKYLKIVDKESFQKKLIIDTMEREKPDIIHAIHVKNGYIPTKWNPGIPVMITVVGADIFREPFESKLVYKRTKQTLRRANLIHTSSSKTELLHMKERFQIDMDKTVINYGYRDEKKIIKGCKTASIVMEKYRIPTNKFLIFLPRGMRDKFKPVLSIIPAIKQLKSKGYKIHIIAQLFGDETLRKKFKEEVSINGLSNDFTFIEEWIPYEDHIGILSLSQLMINLAEDDLLAAPIYESMLVKTIPLLSDIPIYSQFFEGDWTVFFVKNYHDYELAQKVAYICDNINDIQKGTIQNRIKIKKMFNPEKILRKYDRIYTKLHRDYHLK